MFIEIHRFRHVTIKMQIYAALIFMILKCTLSFQDNLPSTKELSHQPSIARNTVTEIYEQLVTEPGLIPSLVKEFCNTSSLIFLIY